MGGAVMRTVLAVAIVMAATPLLAAAQPASDVVDPNAQTKGTSASLNGVKLGASNPWGLTAATVIGDQKDPPNAGFTLISPHGTDSAEGFNPELWSYEYDGYNMEVVGQTVMINVKDPSWPVLWTVFEESLSDTQFAPIVIDLVNITWLDELAMGMTDAAGNDLGYIDFLDAANNSAIALVTKMADDPTQAIFGILGNEYGTADDLVGGINEPVNDDTYIPLTDEELANLPDPNTLKEGYTPDAGTGSTSDGTTPANTASPVPAAVRIADPASTVELTPTATAPVTDSAPSATPPGNAGNAVQASPALLGGVVASLMVLC